MSQLLMCKLVPLVSVHAASQEKQQQQTENDASAAGAAAAATLSSTAVQLLVGDPFLLAVEAQGGPIAAFKEERLIGLLRKWAPTAAQDC